MSDFSAEKSLQLSKAYLFFILYDCFYFLFFLIFQFFVTLVEWEWLGMCALMSQLRFKHSAEVRNRLCFYLPGMIFILEIIPMV